MPRISRRKIDSFIEERMYELFWEYISTLRTKVLVREFLGNLLTRTETVTLAKRLSVAVLLQKGYTFDKIDDLLKVSKGTITTIARQLNSGASGYQKAISSIQAKSKRDALVNTLEEVLIKMSMPARYGSTRYKIKSEIGKEIYKKKVQHENLA
jgi:uncharacterized protein YerC